VRQAVTEAMPIFKRRFEQ